MCFEQTVDLTDYIQTFDEESQSAAYLYLQGYDRTDVQTRLRLSSARMRDVDTRLQRYMQVYLAV